MTGLPIWYELMTPDPVAVAPFYRAVLGWDTPVEGNILPNGADYRQISRADGSFAGGVLKLTQAMHEGGARAGWLPYFHKSNIDAALAMATQKQAKVWMDQTVTGIGRMVMLSDPQGAAFYLMDPVPPPGQPDASSDAFASDVPGHCAWNELSTDDAEGQIAFYTALLGWTVNGEMPMPDAHIYKFLECQGKGIGAVCSMKPDGAPSAWLPYFRVTDIAAAQAAVEANDGTVLQGPHELPGNDVILVVSDPTGAPVGLVGQKAA